MQVENFDPPKQIGRVLWLLWESKIDDGSGKKRGCERIGLIDSGLVESVPSEWKANVLTQHVSDRVIVATVRARKKALRRVRLSSRRLGYNGCLGRAGGGIEVRECTAFHPRLAARLTGYNPPQISSQPEQRNPNSHVDNWDL